MYCRLAALALCLGALSCSRRAQNPAIERIAVLRFENLSADPSIDWMGRAFAQVINRDLEGAPGVYAVPFERVHNLDSTLGARPIQAPGVSAEFNQAVAAGANRLAYGQYYVRGGRLRAAVTIEDVSSHKMIRTLSASAPADDPIEAANQLARQLFAQAAPYPTRNEAAMLAYVTGLESGDPQAKALHLQEAIAADPNFPAPYYLLAQIEQDRAAARALVNQALAPGNKFPALDRARMAVLAAGLRGDRPAAESALADWSRLTPNDPEVWRTLAQDAMLHHQYDRALQAFQRASSIEPDDVSILNSLAYASAYAGRLDTAMSALERYQTLRPADANPLDSMGDVNLLLGRLREAANFYLQSAKKDPNSEKGSGHVFKAAVARLMGGDAGGADALAKQFVDAHRAAKDPLAEFLGAEWSWMSGRRKEAYSQMAAFAHASDSGSPSAVASEAYCELALWSLVLGDRAAAAQAAQKGAALAVPASAGLAALVRFISQPSASPSEWTMRAEQAFPGPAQEPARNLLLAYALLSDKQFAPAVPVLQSLYDRPAGNPEDSLPRLLAWADLESGRPKEAAALLRFNPIPPASAVWPLSVFEFPRIFYLRSRIAALAGNPQQAESEYRLFLQLSGDAPLAWGEERQHK
ncbi:MAG: hypothetical protein JO323_12415 [Acidobacteriia bacterium]|nr:hypothetical protein [Terriglobia bacterium]